MLHVLRFNNFGNGPDPQSHIQEALLRSKIDSAPQQDYVVLGLSNRNSEVLVAKSDEKFDQEITNGAPHDEQDTLIKRVFAQ